MAKLEQQLVELDDAILEVHRGGEGQPIVCCVHPHNSDLEGFKWYADSVGFVYVVVRGLGKSSIIRDTSDLTCLQAAEDLEGVRRELGIERWVVQGFSAGSQIALLYAVMYPDSLVGLITISGFARCSQLLSNSRSLCSPRHPDYQADLERLREQESDRQDPALPMPGHYWARVNEQAWCLFYRDEARVIMRGDQLHERQKAAFEEVTYFDIDRHLKAIDVPTLVVGGRHDPVVPIEDTIAVHDAIPDSRLLVLEHSGHGPEGSDMDIFKETAVRFLSELTT